MLNRKKAIVRNRTEALLHPYLITRSLNVPVAGMRLDQSV